ncbi:MAG: alpha/beta fold hydrolase [Gemmatimonadaceae bacterium]|nr:alpha/beta fold hydrolase [Gemmatimonadaceae bacterium]
MNDHLLDPPIPLAIDDSGAGPTVLLLHPFPLNRLFWRPMVARLGGSLRTIAPDYRGFGNSPGRPPFTMASYAGDIAALIDGLGTGPVVVVGVSMGGYVALELWRRRPDLIRALVLAHTRAEADTPTQAESRRANIALVEAEGPAVLVDRMFDGMIGRTSHASRPDVVAAVRGAMTAAPRQGTLGALQAILERPDSSSTLRTITVPTVVVSGDEDILTPPALQDAIAEGVRGARRVVLPQVGHLGPLEDPVRFAGMLRAFVEPMPRA